jgi:IS1 family transposase
LQLRILVRHLGKDKWPVNVLSSEKQTRVIAALTEGCSVRATERLTDVHQETILNLSRRVGEGCHRLLDGMLRGLQVGVIELDEQWSFIGCKQKNVRDGERERGDSWLFIALDATSKAVLSYRIGKRTTQNTMALAQDLHARLVNRPQITADGFVPYVNAIADVFDRKVDFAQLMKHYGTPAGNEAAVRYSPGSIRGIEKQVVCGAPDETKISTSYVERFNLSTRMHLRRFTRLTNAFSKKLANHRAAIALHLAYYNLVAHPRNDPLHARDGARRDRSSVDRGRAGRGGAQRAGTDAAPSDAAAAPVRHERRAREGYVGRCARGSAEADQEQGQPWAEKIPGDQGRARSRGVVAPARGNP